MVERGDATVGGGESRGEEDENVEGFGFVVWVREMGVSVMFKLSIGQDHYMNRWTNGFIRCLGKSIAERELNKVFFEVSRHSCILRKI